MALPQVGLEAVIENLTGFSKSATVITKAYDDIDASSNKVQKTSAGMSGVFSKVGGGLLSLGKVAAGVALGGVTLLGGGLVALGTKSVLAAADVGEMQSLFNTAFGQDAPKARAEIDEFAASVGRNKYELEGFAGGIKSLVTPMGVTGDKANEMSIGFSKLAVDLSSFYNVTESDALESLRAGLIGETEPLRKFGVVLNAAAVEAEAVRLGLGKTTVDMDKMTAAQGSVTKATLSYNKAVQKYGADSQEAQVAQINLTNAQNRLTKVMEGGKTELDAAAKSQATYSLIMQQTTLAQGDAQRTSGSWVNQMRALRAVIDETVVSIGMELLPVVTPLLQQFTSMAKAVLPGLVGIFKSIISTVSELVNQFTSGFVSNFGNDFGVLGQVIYGIEEVLDSFFPESVMEKIYAFDDAILQLAGKIFGEFEGSTFSLGSIIESVLGAAFSFLIDVVLPALTTAIMFVVDNWDTLKAAISSAIGTVKNVAASIMAVAIPAFEKFQEIISLMSDNLKDSRGIVYGITGAIASLVDNVLLLFGIDTDMAIYDFMESLADIVQKQVIPAIQKTVQWFRKDLPAGASKVQSALKPIINKILPELVDIFNVIYKWTIKNWPLIQKTIGTVLNFIASQVKVVLGTALYIWNNWGDEIMAIVKFVFKVVKVNLQNMLDTVTLIMQLITGDWSGAWETIKGIAERTTKLIFDQVKVVFNNMLSLITSIMTSIKNKISDIWSSIVSTVKDKAQEAYNAVKSKFDSLASLISGYASSLLTAAKKMMQGIIDGINAMLSSITSTLNSVMTSAINSLKNAITSGSLYSLLIASGQAIINAIKNGIAMVTDLAGRLISAVQAAVNNLASSISSGAIYNILIQAGRNIINYISSGISAVTSLGSTLVSKVQDAINSLFSSNIFSRLYDIGEDIVNGIIDGVKAMGSELGGVLQDIVDDAIQAIKEQLGIASPSKVFFGVGIDMMKGLQAGISALAPSISMQLQSAVAGPAVNAPALGATGTTNIYNSYQLGGNTINSGMDQAQFEARVMRAIRRNL